MAVLARILDPAHPLEAVQAVAAALAARDSGEVMALLPLPEHAEAAQRLLTQVPADPAAHLPPGTALLVGTSGSTGTPKLAVLSARAVRASIAATQATLGGAGQWLLALPTHTVAGVQVLARSALAGTTPVALETGRFTPEGFAAAATRLDSPRRYTALVPTQLLRLLEQASAVQALRGLDAVLLGGAPAAPALLKRAKQLGVRVVTTYGMTETCGGCVYDGLPLPGVQVSIEADSPQHSGRVLLAGPVLFSGYLSPQGVDRSLVQGRWLRTNDEGHLDAAGRLHVEGRLDDVVISGGVNVSLSAVEQAASSCPTLAGYPVAAVAVPDAQWGQRVILAVHTAGGCIPSTLRWLEPVRAYLAQRLGAAAAPGQVVAVQEWPLLPSGKLDRQRLANHISPQKGGHP